MPGRKKRILIATSGWHYGHWVGPFYPEGTPTERFLEHYAARFSTVEINSTFYRLPTEKTVRSWCAAVPDDFVFSVKASRLITHNKKLLDPERTLPPFLERLRAFGRKAGPVLFQLPPRWGVNVERLEAFLSALPRGHRYAFEFRDTSWFDGRVYDTLARHNAAFCIYDFDRLLSPATITARFAYVRLHGPDGKYRGRYSDDALCFWAGEFARWDVDEIYCYFDNDEAGYAPGDALRLKGMVEGAR
ncbi:MAG: DUF72 domain-containing protein [Thermodesulfobacteriota bacterium]